MSWLNASCRIHIRSSEVVFTKTNVMFCFCIFNPVLKFFIQNALFAFCITPSCFPRGTRIEASVRRQGGNQEVSSFEESWSCFGSKYDNLKMYCGRIASVMPGTSTVESDFSLINWTEGPHSQRMTDFKLESILHAKQYGSFIIIEISCSILACTFSQTLLYIYSRGSVYVDSNQKLYRIRIMQTLLDNIQETLEFIHSPNLKFEMDRIASWGLGGEYSRSLGREWRKCAKAAEGPIPRPVFMIHRRTSSQEATYMITS